jgi:YHS domain-containing protein
MAGRTGLTAFDVICGMWLETSQIAVTYTYLGQTYAFCCKECCDIFARVPEAHVVRLAHEPGTSAGHRCPYQRLRSGSSVARPEHKAPRK